MRLHYFTLDYIPHTHTRTHARTQASKHALTNSRTHAHARTHEPTHTHTRTVYIHIYVYNPPYHFHYYCKRVNTCWLPNLIWWRIQVSKMKSCIGSCSQRACTASGSGMKSCNGSCSQRACTAFGSGMKSCNGSCSQRECTAYRYLCSADFDCQAFFFGKHVCLTCMCLLDFDWFL